MTSQDFLVEEIMPRSQFDFHKRRDSLVEHRLEFFAKLRFVFLPPLVIGPRVFPPRAYDCPRRPVTLGIYGGPLVGLVLNQESNSSLWKQRGRQLFLSGKSSRLSRRIDSVFHEQLETAASENLHALIASRINYERPVITEAINR